MDWNQSIAIWLTHQRLILCLKKFVQMWWFIGKSFLFFLNFANRCTKEKLHIFLPIDASFIVWFILISIIMIFNLCNFFCEVENDPKNSCFSCFRVIFLTIHLHWMKDNACNCIHMEWIENFQFFLFAFSFFDFLFPNFRSLGLLIQEFDWNQFGSTFKLIDVSVKFIFLHCPFVCNFSFCGLLLFGDCIFVHSFFLFLKSCWKLFEIEKIIRIWLEIWFGFQILSKSRIPFEEDEIFFFLPFAWLFQSVILFLIGKICFCRWMMTWFLIELYWVDNLFVILFF